jgi:hypothetical protein
MYWDWWSIGSTISKQKIFEFFFFFFNPFRISGSGEKERHDINTKFSFFFFFLTFQVGVVFQFFCFCFSIGFVLFLSGENADGKETTQFEDHTETHTNTYYFITMTYG